MLLEIEFNYTVADLADPMSNDDLDVGDARLNGELLQLPPAAARAAHQLLDAVAAIRAH